MMSILASVLQLLCHMFTSMLSTQACHWLASYKRPCGLQEPNCELHLRAGLAAGLQVSWLPW